MRCLTAFGERISARDPDGQTTEIQIRVALNNRFNAFATAEIVRMAQRQWGRDKSRLKHELRKKTLENKAQ